MLCKIRTAKHGETCSSCGTRKTNYAWIVEADESTRKRMEGFLHEDHEDFIAGRGINSLNHYNLVHKFIPLPQAMKIQDAKAAVEKNGKNSRKYRHGSLTKVRNKKRWSMKQGKKQGKKTKLVHFASWLDICHLKNSELEPTFQKIQRLSCTPSWHCKRWFKLLCSIHWTRIFSISNDSS